MGKKKQLKVLSVSLSKFSFALIEEFDEARINLLKKARIWDYLPFIHMAFPKHVVG